MMDMPVTGGDEQQMSEAASQAPAMRMIWKSAGLHLVEADRNGWLKVTPDLLRAYFTRPEVHPVAESCDGEHALFEKLMADPFAEVQPAELERIADDDAADNYRVVLAFRDHLAASGTLEAAYLKLFTMDSPPMLPPVFIDQLTHLIVAGLLRKERDVMVVRAGELFFREQKVTTADGQIMLADAEVVEMYSETGGFGGLGNLLAEAGTPMREVALDVLTAENAAGYWEQADQFNHALDFRYTEAGPDALARMIEKWVRHFLGVETRVQAMQSIRDQHWSWHVGLDAEASRLLNALYEGGGSSEDVAPLAADRLAGLFRMEFMNRSDVIEAMRGKAVYLGLAMDANRTIKMKPQNLLVNLPLRKAS